MLSKSKVNTERASEGKLPANCVLLRDAGDHVPELEPFEQKYGLKGTALVEMPAEVGIARMLGMKMVKVADRNDMKEKASLFTSELREGTVVYVHIKGPDEFGHDGNPTGKMRNIESIDSDFFSAVAARLGDLRLGISCDHSTPCTLKMHSSDLVPLSISADKVGDRMRFTEKNARAGSLGLLKGRDVLGRVVNFGSGDRS